MKKFQLTELISLSLLSAILIMAAGTVLTIIGLIDTLLLYNLCVFALCLITIGCIVVPIGLLVVLVIKSNEQKPHSFYNVLSDVVEFHIGSRVKSDIGLIKPMLAVKSYAEELNKDIVFCTVLIDVEKVTRLEKRFNVKIEITPASNFDKVLFSPYWFALIWRKNIKRYPLVKGVVRIRE